MGNREDNPMAAFEGMYDDIPSTRAPATPYDCCGARVTDTPAPLGPQTDVRGPLDGTEPTIYVGDGPARVDGSPVLGNFGKRVETFVIMDIATWKRLCNENPGLQTTRFRVGNV